MWWFLRQRERATADGQPTSDRLDTEKEIRSEDEFLALFPPLAALDEHDATIKIWLPETPARLVKWLAERKGTSQSAWLRDRLAEYVYGRGAVTAQRIREKRRESDRPMFSRAPVDRTKGRYVYLVPQLGKNVVAFKLWASRQLRNDLESLAAHAGVGLSPFVREAVLADLLGRGSLPERPAVLGAATAAAQAWERGDEVPNDTVEIGAFDGLGTAEFVWVENETSGVGSPFG